MNRAPQGFNERIARMVDKKSGIVKYIAFVFLLGASHSNASSKDAVGVSVENPVESSGREIRVLGQVFGQIGSGNIGDGYVGTSRDVNSDLGVGLRIGSGVSWKYVMAVLNAEYVYRSLKISETPVTAMVLPSEKKEYGYHYLKLQPEFVAKVNLSNDFDVGGIAGYGVRYKVNGDKPGDGPDKSFSLGCYGQYLGVNVRVSEEFFWQSRHNTETRSTAFGVGYSYEFEL